MTNSRLIAYLKTLNKAEMRDFGRHIKASKGIKDVSILYDYLLSYHPKYPEKYLNKDHIASKIFPKENNIAKKFTNVMYRFGQLLDDFLVYEELKVKEAEKDLLLLHALKRRQLDQYFFRKAEQIEEDWKKNPPAGLEHLHNKYRLREIYDTHHNYPLTKKTSTNPKHFIYHIDTYYFAIKLYEALSARNNQSYIADLNEANHKEYLLDEILKLSQNSAFSKVPQIKLISNLLRAFINNDFKDFLSLKNEFLNFINLYNKKEQYDIAIFLYSVCYENYKSGRPEALQQLFELNCLMIENQFLLRDGRIRTDQFWNIVNIGFAFNQLTWTEKFILEFGRFLQKNEQQDVLTICNALLSYHNSKYEDAIQKLATVKYQNVLYGLLARSIQLRSYYELGDDYYQMYLSLTKSFYLFLNRNTLSNETKLQFKNFIAFSKKLLHTKNKSNSFDFDTLSSKINTSNVACKRWLLAKLDELQMIGERNKKEKVKVFK